MNDGRGKALSDLRSGVGGRGVARGALPPLLARGGLTSTGAAADRRQETSPAQATPTGPGPIQVVELARLFPQLEIQKRVGPGGMGALCLARQKALDRLVAKRPEAAPWCVESPAAYV